MRPPILLVHDYDPLELRTTAETLQRRPDLQDFEVERYTSRNRFLRRISLADGERTIALVDLCADESTDLGFKGMRIIETISRHRRLAYRTRPVALTRHARGDVRLALEQAGAQAILHKGPMERDDAGLRDTLEAILRLPCRPWTGTGERTICVPDDGEPMPSMDPDEAFSVIFNDLKRTPRMTAIIRAWWEGRTMKEVAAGQHVSGKTVEKDVAAMRAAARPAFLENGKLSYTQCAAAFFRSCPALKGLPADLAELPDPMRVRPLAWDDDVMRNAWLDDRAERALSRVLGDIRAGESWIEAVARAEFDPLAAKTLGRDVTRAVYALMDADLSCRLDAIEDRRVSEQR